MYTGSGAGRYGARSPSSWREHADCKALLGVTDPLLLARAALSRLGHRPGARDGGPGRSLALCVRKRTLRARDLPWLGAIGILFGGLLGPALLMSGLTLTPASSGALLLNTEVLPRWHSLAGFPGTSIAAFSWVRWLSSPGAGIALLAGR